MAVKQDNFPGTPSPSSARDNQATYGKGVTTPNWGSAVPEAIDPFYL
ncbi:MAG: hypothetical protein WCS87_18650 [Methylococcaceae bacterium]